MADEVYDYAGEFFKKLIIPGGLFITVAGVGLFFLKDFVIAILTAV